MNSIKLEKFYGFVWLEVKGVLTEVHINLQVGKTHFALGEITSIERSSAPQKLTVYSTKNGNKYRSEF